MSDTEIQAVETPAPDANAAPETEVVEAAPSPAVNDTDEIAAKAKGVGKRIDELTRNWRETERDRDYWRDLAIRSQQTTPQPQPAQPQSEALKTLADFEFDDAKYQAYIFETAQKRSVEAARLELEKDRERQTKAQRDASFRSRATEFAKTAEDFEEVTFRNTSLPITDSMADVIKESDDGPALFYHLGKNPDVAAKIAQLPPLVAARELGKIEARLAAERERAKEKPVSKAPAPAPRVEGVDPSVSAKTTDASGDALGDKEWFELEKKRMSKRR